MKFDKICWADLRGGWTRLHFIRANGKTLCNHGSVPAGRETRQTGEMCGACRRIAAKMERDQDRREVSARARRDAEGCREGAGDIDNYHNMQYNGNNYSD